MELEFAALDRDDGGGLGGVAVLVERGDPAGAGKIFRGGDGVAELRALGDARAADSVDEDVEGVVTEGGVGIGGFVFPAGLEFLHEGGDGGLLVFRGEVGGVVGAVERLAADLEKLLGLPSVAAEERNGEAEVAGLAGDEGGLLVVAGDEDGLDVGGLDGGELRFEILVAFAEFLLGHDGAAAGDEGFLEELGEADAVGAGDADEGGDLLGLEIIQGELRHDGALEIVDEADAEDVVAFLGDGRIGGAGGDQGDFRGLGERGDLEGAAGRHFAEDGDDFVAGEQFFGDGGRLAGLGLVVLGDEFELAAEDAAGGVEFFEGQQNSFVLGLAKGGVFAGEAGEFADFDGFGGAGERREEEGERGEDEGGRFHEGEGERGDEEGARGGRERGRLRGTRTT